MTDRYQDFVSSSLGQLLVKNLGLPNPVRLERYVAGSPLVDGSVVVGGTGRLVEHLPGVLDSLGIAVRAGHHCAKPAHARFGVQASTRASFYLYTTTDEVDALVRGLDKVRKVFG